MANDGFGNCCNDMLFQWLADRENNFSYCLVICPEHIGSVHYLANPDNEERDNFVGGVFGERWGHNTLLHLAQHFGVITILMLFSDISYHSLLKKLSIPSARTPGMMKRFGTPGYEIPLYKLFVLIASKPFPEYHSELDTPDLNPNVF